MKMQVYSLLCSEPYEGYELLGVFASHEDALQFLKERRERAGQLLAHCDFGVVCSELGKEVDVWGDCEWNL